MQKLSALLVFLSTLVVALSGCASDTEDPVEEEVVDKETYALGANFGAIAGLLVDDRF